MPLTITTVAGGVTFTDVTAGFTGVEGQYLIDAKPQGAEYRIQSVRAPGVDGSAEIRFGFATRQIENIEVVYIKSSKANCLTAYETDHAALKNTACALDYHGALYPACNLRQFDITKGPKATSQNGKYRLHCQLAFEQKRLD